MNIDYKAKAAAEQKISEAAARLSQEAADVAADAKSQELKDKIADKAGEAVNTVKAGAAAVADKVQEK